MSLVLLGRERDREVRGALADRRRATHRARAEALERRPLVGRDAAISQLVADQLVVVLGVGDRRLQQLAPVAGDPRGAKARIARASSTDLPRMWSQTRRALRADVRTYLAWARTTGAAPAARPRRGGAARRAGARAAWRGGVGLASAAASASASARRVGRVGSSPRRFAARPPRRRPCARAARLRPRLGRLARGGFAPRAARLRRRRPSAAPTRLAPASASRPPALDAGGLGLASGRLDSGLVSVAISAPFRSRRGHGTGASARTRRACGRPSTR